MSQDEPSWVKDPPPALPGSMPPPEIPPERAPDVIEPPVAPEQPPIHKPPSSPGEIVVIDTPAGVLKLKRFFSRPMLSGNGRACSGTAIRGLIGALIRDQARQAPLSDATICQHLSEQAPTRCGAAYRHPVPPDAARAAVGETLPGWRLSTSETAPRRMVRKPDRRVV